MDYGSINMDDGLFYAFMTIGGIIFVLFIAFITQPTPEETQIYEECQKLQNIKKVYNNLSLEQKDYIYNNCI